MKASSVVIGIIGIAAGLALMVYLPYQVIEKVSAKQLDPVFGAVVILLLLLAGGVLSFFTLVLPILEFMGEEEGGEEEVEEKLTMYRARQRAMLEELDEIERTLEEIRDILKKGMGE